MKELKIISLVNFVRGGKSSISRLLAEKLSTTILNFDPKRDSEIYNVIKTTNIPEDSKITKKTNCLKIETDINIIEISSKSNFFICDFGGRFDERIKEFESNLYIMPTMDDYESINETIKATKYILKYNQNAKIIHILNMAMCYDKVEKEEFVKGYKSNIEINNLTHIKYLEMPRSKLLKKIINDGLKGSDIMGDSLFLKKGAYKNINKFIDKLIKLINEQLED